MYPECFGGSFEAKPLKRSDARRTETLEALKIAMHEYPRGKNIDFGHVRFLSAARESLLRSTEAAIRQSENMGTEWQFRLKLLQAEWESELAARDAAYEAQAVQLRRQAEYQARLEREKDELRRQYAAERAAWNAELAKRDENNAYLRRKLSQPRSHDEIAAWAAAQFGGRLILHQRAVGLLEDSSARTVSVELICDALDFLATDYWERRYVRTSEADMLSRCSRKYGRPFEVSPTGQRSIEVVGRDYKIKYGGDVKDKPRERPLDYHLKVGNDSENLLRVYFLHDDERQLIVVGSLPRHLKTATMG